MTGRIDGLPYQVPGTRPRTGPSGHAYLSAVNLRAASSVVPGAGAAGDAGGPRWAACAGGSAHAGGPDDAHSVHAAAASASAKRSTVRPIPLFPASVSPMIVASYPSNFLAGLPRPSPR